MDRERIPQELEKLQGMVDYCHTENCLQQFIVTLFWRAQWRAMWSMWKLYGFKRSKEVTKEVQMVLSCVVRMGQKFGKTITAQVLTGSKNKKVMDFGFRDYLLMEY